MGQEIVYCSRCGDRILTSEFGEGLAATVEGMDYCRKCMKADSGQAGDAVETRDTTPSPSRSTQKPIARLKEARPPWKPALDTSKRTLLIIAVVVLAVLLALVLVILTKQGSGR